MRETLRDQGILVLRLKTKWYDLIESWEKTEEYRDNTEYWRTRIFGSKPLVSTPIKEIYFYKGYPPRGTPPLVRRVSEITVSGATIILSLGAPFA